MNDRTSLIRQISNIAYNMKQSPAGFDAAEQFARIQEIAEQAATSIADVPARNLVARARLAAYWAKMGVYPGVADTDAAKLDYAEMQFARMEADLAQALGLSLNGEHPHGLSLIGEYPSRAVKNNELASTLKAIALEIEATMLSIPPKPEIAAETLTLDKLTSVIDTLVEVGERYGMALVRIQKLVQSAVD